MTHRYLKAAKRRNAEKAGPSAIAKSSETRSHSCCRCASAGERRSTIASPNAAITIGKRRQGVVAHVFAGCQSTQRSANAPSSPSIHGGPIV